VEKLIYLLWDEHPGESDDLRHRIVDELGSALLALEPRRLSINVADAESAIPSPVPTPDGEQPHVAEVSLWLDCHDRRGPFEEAIAAVGLRHAGYLVLESLYTDYGDTGWAGARDWPDGERSPSVLTVCLIHRPDGMSQAEWLERWHGTQSPVSAELQPRIRYVRNEVVRPITPDAPEIGGIVEEAWPSALHISDPMLFFRGEGDPERLQRNIERMLESVTAFIDMDRMRNVCMSEYLLFT
jgi:hypothetical protein